MKKWMTVVLSLVMALSLSACGEEPEPPAIPTEEPVEGQTVELEYFLEGDPVTVTANRYVGDGYTIDIPAEDWTRETGDEEGYASVSWEPEVNDDVELEVIRFPGMTLEQVREWIRTEEDDYDLIEDKRGGLGGMDTEDQDVLEVRLYEGTDTAYAMLLKYPMEAMEGFGTTMGVIADTFVLN